MEKPILNPNEWLISIDDVKRLYISMWKRLFKWTLGGAILAVLYFANAPVHHKACATFKEGVENSGSGGFFKEMMMGMGNANFQPSTAAIMKSNSVLRPLAEKMGLQIEPVKPMGKIKKLYTYLKESYRAEKGLPLEEIDNFHFSNVFYEGEKGFDFSIVFDEEGFAVLSEETTLCRALLGEEVNLEGFRFTLTKVPKNIQHNQKYPFKVSHWASAVGGLKGAFTIKKDEDNPSVLNIFCKHRDRYLAQSLANELMIQYQKYLKDEYDFVAKSQLDYLETKQTQVLSKMDELLKNQSSYLHDNLLNNGFVGLEEESQSLLTPHNQMYSRLFDIEIELRHIKRISDENNAITFALFGPFGDQLNSIHQEIHELKQKREQLELALCKEDFPTPASQSEELQLIREKRLAIERSLQDLSTKKQVGQLEFCPSVQSWANTLDGEHLDDLREYFVKAAKRLAIREKVVQERIYSGNAIPEEFEGLDQGSCGALFLSYNEKLDREQESLRHLGELQKNIENPNFELTPLISVLDDPLSCRLISEVSDFEFKIKDERFRSEKEVKLWQEEIMQRRAMLVSHMDRLKSVHEINTGIILEKMRALQRLMLDGTTQQISLLRQQIRDLIHERKESLLLERSVIEKEVTHIRQSLAEILPEKWRFERWLAIKTALVTKLMETVTEVVESKSMENQMHRVESKPLDFSLTPAFAESPKLKMMGMLGAACAHLFCFALALGGAMMKGMPLNTEKIKALKLPFAGAISPFCDGPHIDVPKGDDLNILRHIALFSEGGKVIGLMGNRGPDYTYALGENLGRRKANAIIVRMDFQAKTRKQAPPGLLQVWQKEIDTLPIIKAKGYDLLPSGGFTPFGAEIIQSESFLKVLDALKKKYEWVYLYCRSPLASAETHSVLRLCDRAVLTVCKELTEELTPFVDWGYSENQRRITFITEA